MDRPTSVTVFGVINTCYGVLSLCLVVFSLLFQALVYSGLWEIGNISLDAWGMSTFQMIYSIIGLLASTALSTLLTVTGAGLLSGKSWARRGSVLYAKIGAIVVAINVVITIGITMLVSDAMYEATGVELTQEQIDFTKRMSVVGTLISALVPLVHCALVYRFMNAKHVIAWFEKAEWDGDDGVRHADE